MGLLGHPEKFKVTELDETKQANIKQTECFLSHYHGEAGDKARAEPESESNKWAREEGWRVAKLAIGCRLRGGKSRRTYHRRSHSVEAGRKTKDYAEKRIEPLSAYGLDTSGDDLWKAEKANGR